MMATKLNLLKEQLFTWKYAMANTDTGIDDTVQADFMRTLQEEIDAEIMFDLLKQKGWHHVELDTPVDDQVATRWLSKNASGKHHGRWQNWLFENEKDAVMFSLRWL
jgi:hypothetical protein